LQALPAGSEIEEARSFIREFGVRSQPPWVLEYALSDPALRYRLLGWDAMGREEIEEVLTAIWAFLAARVTS
jgi:hypothetical protein